MAETRRRLATVLFLDIVGSTALAAELGDSRWRDLLTRFRRVVRAELKRHGGRERDTTGDGFLATFQEPARALRAAVAIAVTVQELGLDVRQGVHTGECEEVDGTLGGIAVHVGARVMALAGAAEVFVTETVKDLVSGSSASFDDRGLHELKGVPGVRHVFGLRSLEITLPAPLTREEVASRLSLLGAAPRGRRRRTWLAAAALVLAVAAAAAVVLVTGSKGKTVAKPQQPIRLVRIDGSTARVTGEIRGGPSSRGDWSNLWDVDGTLWQFIGSQDPSSARLVARRLPDGRIERSLPVPGGCSCGVAFGFGSVWLVNTGFIPSGPNAGLPRVDLLRVDELSGRHEKTILFPGNVADGTIATGNGAVWVLEQTGELVRIDPLTNRVVGRYETGAEETSTLIPVAGRDWICECLFNSVLRFDPRNGRTHTFGIPEQAYLVGVEASHGATLWLLDPSGSTLTPMDPVTGKTGQPLGLAGNPQQAVIAFGSVWTAAGRVIDRVDLQSRVRTTIAMPRGVWAGSIAADPATHSLWVGNSGVAPPPSPS